MTLVARGNGRWTAVLAALVGVAGSAVIMFTAELLHERTEVINQVSIHTAVLDDLSKTNRGILRELKAIRLGLAKAGIVVEVEP